MKSILALAIALPLMASTGVEEAKQIVARPRQLRVQLLAVRSFTTSFAAIVMVAIMCMIAVTGSHDIINRRDITTNRADIAISTIISVFAIATGIRAGIATTGKRSKLAPSGAFFFEVHAYIA